tara:strand:- start:884 stop:2167 length:1284 start_codon:yes stop_codon:yes gene_type:complete
MDSKFLLCILTSYNEKLLKISYNSALNQVNHNLNYTIIIIVNSLDTSYYNNVCDEFKNIDVEIIQTVSNGKPGMGHNSVINLFKNRLQYDYMLLLDGDDFLYPSALEQLTKCFKKENKIDMLVLKSTDKLKFIEDDNYDFFDINLNNNFIISSKIYIDYKLYPWNNEHMGLSNFFENSLCTPIRLFLLNRTFFNYYTNELFHNECKLYDDYLTFLYFVRASANPNLNCYIIPGKYIYLYNSININSVTHNTNDENDIIYYDKLKNEFSDILQIFNYKWDLTQLPTLYISHKYDVDYKYEICEEFYNISMNINYNTICNDPNYIYLKKNGINLINQVIESYYNISELNFMNNNYVKSLQYALFFNKHNITNIYISFIILYSIHILHSKTIDILNINLFKKHINTAMVFVNFYNLKSLTNYIDFIKNIK